jgi:hypothetical protein
LFFNPFSKTSILPAFVFGKLKHDDICKNNRVLLMLAMTASASGSTTAAFVIGYIPYLQA